VAFKLYHGMMVTGVEQRAGWVKVSSPKGHHLHTFSVADEGGGSGVAKNDSRYTVY
jgi:hypothetical protein